MKLISILLISLVLTGCGFEELLPDQEPEVIEKEVIKEVIKEKIIYKDRNITIPCNTTNVTCPECIIYNSTYNPKERELKLIRRISFLEGQQDKYWNYSECDWELNRSEVKLKECEDELCFEWNSSWCN